MLDKEKEIFNRLLDALKILIQRYENLKKQNETLFQEKQNLFAQLKQKDDEINQLKNEIKLLETGNAFILGAEGESPSKKRHDAKLKINTIIREIDNCITLLNYGDEQ